MEKYEKLTSPGQIGPVKTRNRMLKPAQSMHYAGNDGYISEANLGFYEKIAQSGIGLIVVEMAAVDYPEGHPSLKDLLIHEDRFVPRLAELAKLIHKYDVPAFLQITHSGPSHDPVEKSQPRAASTLKAEEMPRATYGPTLGLTIAEIEDLIEKFAKGAERAQKAGYDGIEVHGAHAYLLNSFFSPAWNKRTDKYGGSTENRARFACEILRAIKSRVGKDYPVGMRINGGEYGLARDGLTLEEAKAIAKLLAEAGVDYLHVSAFGYGAQYNRVTNPEQVFYPEAPRPLGPNLDGSRKGKGLLTLLAAGVKQAVSVPVVAVGRLDPETAEMALREGRADFVAMGRFVLADPESIKKTLEGREEDIAPCTACLSCVNAYGMGNAVICRINAAIGKEREYEIKPAAKPKKVTVIGGGPAGMEAARVAALRGHKVTLYEKESRLGGAVLILTMVKGTEVEDYTKLLAYFRTQLKKLGVTVRTGKTMDQAAVLAEKPDVVIVATGGIPALPEIKGINSKNVMPQGRLHQMVKPYLKLFGPLMLRRLTRLYLPVGEKVVIIGGGVEGTELAEFLVRRGRKVTLTDTRSELGIGMVGMTKARLLPWLEKKGVRLMPGVKYEEITDKGITLTAKDGKKETIPADTVLTALTLKPNYGIFEALKGKVPEVYIVGDAGEPHLILEAVATGFQTALKI